MGQKKWPFSTRSGPPCSKWGWKQIFNWPFSSWSVLVCPLPTKAPYSSLPVLPPTEMGWRCIRGRPDGIPEWRLIPHHYNLGLIFASSLISPAVKESSLLSASHTKTTGEASVFHMPVYILNTGLTTVKMVSHKGMNSNKGVIFDTCPGVGCHFLLQWMKVKSEREVAQSCPTLSDPMDYSLPGSSIHGIFQARILEWGAIAFCFQKICFHLTPPFFFRQNKYFINFCLEISLCVTW